MSLISDALKKAQQQHFEPLPIRASGWKHSAGASATTNSSPPPGSSLRFAVVNVAVLAAICLVALYAFQDRAPRSERGLAAATPTQPVSSPTAEPVPAAVALSSLSTVSAAASTPLPSVTRSVGTAAPRTTKDYELGGTSSLGSNTLLSIVRREDKRSIWVPVGKTVAEVTAVSYDPAENRALIRVRGTLYSVSTREDSESNEPSVRTTE